MPDPQGAMMPDQFVTRDEFGRFAKGIERAIEGLHEAFAEQRKSMHDIATTQAGSGKLATGGVVAIAAAMVTTVGVASGVIALVGAMALNPVRSDISEMKVEIRSDNSLERGYAERFGTIEASMLSIAAHAEAQIRELAARVDGEIKLATVVQDQNEKRIEDLEDWQQIVGEDVAVLKSIFVRMDNGK